MKIKMLLAFILALFALAGCGHSNMEHHDDHELVNTEYHSDTN